MNALGPLALIDREDKISQSFPTVDMSFLRNQNAPNQERDTEPWNRTHLRKLEAERKGSDHANGHAMVRSSLASQLHKSSLEIILWKHVWFAWFPNLGAP